MTKCDYVSVRVHKLIRRCVLNVLVALVPSGCEINCFAELHVVDRVLKLSLGNALYLNLLDHLPVSLHVYNVFLDELNHTLWHNSKLPMFYNSKFEKLYLKILCEFLPALLLQALWSRCQSFEKQKHFQIPILFIVGYQYEGARPNLASFTLS